MTAQQAQQVAALLKALADPVRLRLMSLVASPPQRRGMCLRPQPEHSTCRSRRSATSRVLHEPGLLDRQNCCVRIYYRAHIAALADLATLIGASASTGGVTT
jgi:ArsR family transcriptional regulator